MQMSLQQTQQQGSLFGRNCLVIIQARLGPVPARIASTQVTGKANAASRNARPPAPASPTLATAAALQSRQHASLPLLSGKPGSMVFLWTPKDSPAAPVAGDPSGSGWKWAVLHRLKCRRPSKGLDIGFVGTKTKRLWRCGNLSCVKFCSSWALTPLENRQRHPVRGHLTWWPLRGDCSRCLHDDWKYTES